MHRTYMHEYTHAYLHTTYVVIQFTNSLQEVINDHSIVWPQTDQSHSTWSQLIPLKVLSHQSLCIPILHHLPVRSTFIRSSCTTSFQSNKQHQSTMEEGPVYIIFCNEQQHKISSVTRYKIFGAVTIEPAQDKFWV